MAVAPDAIDRVESVAEVDALPARPDQPVALLAQTTLSPPRLGRRRSSAAARAVPRPVAAGPQRPVLRHHQPPVGARRDRPALRRRRRHRLGQLVQHPGPREAGPRGRAATGCYRVNGADELPDDLAGTVGVTAGASAPEELVEAVIARLAPARRGRGGRASPTRTSTSRRPASCASCSPASTCWPPSASAARSPTARPPTTARSPPATSSRCSTDVEPARRPAGPARRAARPAARIGAVLPLTSTPSACRCTSSPPPCGWAGSSSWPGCCPACGRSATTLPAPWRGRFNRIAWPAFAVLVVDRHLEPGRAAGRRLRHRVAGHAVREDPGGGRGRGVGRGPRRRALTAPASPRPAPSAASRRSRPSCWGSCCHG